MLRLSALSNFEFGFTGLSRSGFSGNHNEEAPQTLRNIPQINSMSMIELRIMLIQTLQHQADPQVEAHGQPKELPLIDKASLLLKSAKPWDLCWHVPSDEHGRNLSINGFAVWGLW